MQSFEKAQKKNTLCSNRYKANIVKKLVTTL